MGSKTFVRSCSYDYGRLKPLIFEMLSLLDREGLISRGKQILIKPNLLAPARPEEAVVTHHSLVKAVVEYVLFLGGKPVVADSPAMGSWDRLIKISGLKDALTGLPVRLGPFSDSTFVDIGEPFGRIELAREAVEAEVIINLPKLKTHAQMLLTLGVKNMFGCVVGLRKPKWHMQMGERKDLFARLLVQICKTLKPAFTVVDGILALEGEGPRAGGRPRELGYIIAGDDPFAVDAAICRLLKVKEEDLLTLSVAKGLGFFPGEVEIEGEYEGVNDFLLPPPSTLLFGPPFLHGILRRCFLERPVCAQDSCLFCGQCGEFCPAEAIKVGERKLIIDYNKCIRCYCCIEVCPEGAIRMGKPFLRRILANRG